MGRISMATRDELVGALVTRYGASNRRERGRIPTWGNGRSTSTVAASTPMRGSHLRW
jgi:hypothetical protein